MYPIEQDDRGLAEYAAEEQYAVDDEVNRFATGSSAESFLCYLTNDSEALIGLMKLVDMNRELAVKKNSGRKIYYDFIESEVLFRVSK